MQSLIQNIFSGVHCKYSLHSPQPSTSHQNTNHFNSSGSECKQSLSNSSRWLCTRHCSIVFVRESLWAMFSFSGKLQMWSDNKLAETLNNSQNFLWDLWKILGFVKLEFIKDFPRILFTTFKDWGWLCRILIKIPEMSEPCVTNVIVGNSPELWQDLTCFLVVLQ